MVLSSLRMRAILGSNPVQGASFEEMAILVKNKNKLTSLVKNNFARLYGLLV